MQFLACTLETPAANLALDEALLGVAETGDEPRDVLRIWESRQPMVVVGRATRLEEEVKVDTCRELGIPVLRRTSGGAAIVAGPGCLMYSVVLSYELHPEVQAIDRAHGFVLERVISALRQLNFPAQRDGTCDVVVHGRKVSGNSCRCRRRALLYHGTLLYAYPLSLISTCLKMPPRQPDYRLRRPHDDFVGNLTGVTPRQLEDSLRTAFGAIEILPSWSREAVNELVAEKFENPEWNLLR